MSLQYRAKFETFVPTWRNTTTNQILVNPETEAYTNEVYVEVSNMQDENSKYYLTIKCEIPTTFFKGLTYYGNFLVVAVENYVYIINLLNKQSNAYKIGGYFNKFWRFSDTLLVITNSRIGCIDTQGKLKWRSGKLGTEKIELAASASQTINGRGKWNDTIGWKPFSLNPDSGTAFLRYENTKKSRVIFSRMTQMIGI
ncbi:MAG TPA: hypothetical protein DCQ26_19120 [Marinilabiliales bacterium]|nr:MAG: hypothetical protein A2W95_01060 [Bacteroidetes bacterium GWA2_40_14]OFX57153.1 MAG: hypothetical protein A2W84_16165 [Bacteroidetes bacterium GWC2_40_13]OFX72511.1 MAG: hypothetical protein A2W96_05585 [Bacteroidetes bacterium GWD2_40_43]OFX90595.1 MAG: hypothetical protein A2W97_02355 [Bacteroidetes bacterium GWE2_40_63]OFY20927.1 MAG: hypothetical protein A2W88_17905 [Bacteroidetes bacterium GWF2_40_13]OFZ23653.1 MAG: hypothetical protein A2437_06325 [Bacteroidetes bacterium RIFOXYC